MQFILGSMQRPEDRFYPCCTLFWYVLTNLRRHVTKFASSFLQRTIRLVCRYALVAVLRNSCLMRKCDPPAKIAWTTWLRMLHCIRAAQIYKRIMTIDISNGINPSLLFLLSFSSLSLSLSLSLPVSYLSAYNIPYTLNVVLISYEILPRKTDTKIRNNNKKKFKYLL